MFSLSEEPLDGGALRAGLDDTAGGALVVFEGRVRASNLGRGVTAREYEACAPVCRREAERLLAEVRRRPGVLALRVVHRVGRLEPGDVALWIGVLAAHRAEAFDACRELLEGVKHRLPVWKREHGDDGAAVWLRGEEPA